MPQYQIKHLLLLMAIIAVIFGLFAIVRSVFIGGPTEAVLITQDSELHGRLRELLQQIESSSHRKIDRKMWRIGDEHYLTVCQLEASEFDWLRGRLDLQQVDAEYVSACRVRSHAELANYSLTALPDGQYFVSGSLPDPETFDRYVAFYSPSTNELFLAFHELW